MLLHRQTLHPQQVVGCASIFVDDLTDLRRAPHDIGIVFRLRVLLVFFDGIGSLYKPLAGAPIFSKFLSIKN